MKQETSEQKISTRLKIDELVKLVAYANAKMREIQDACKHTDKISRTSAYAHWEECVDCGKFINACGPPLGHVEEKK